MILQPSILNTVRLEYALNPGGFLSLGSSLPDHVRSWVFVGLNSCMMLALCAYLVLNRHVSFAIFVCGVFILAGGIGNQIDRVCQNGLVTDFVSVGVGRVRTGVFNVADMALTFGAVAAMFLSLCDRRAGQSDPPGRRTGSS